MKILGIDPGFDRVGWAIVDRELSLFHLVSCGAVQTIKTESLPQRLRKIALEIKNICCEFEPDQVVIEKLFFATNAKTAIDVAQARGVVLLTCFEHIKDIVELTPLQIKSAVTGDGHADKKAVEKMVRLQVKGVPPKVLDDTIDAIAAAMSA
ncbi:crossover junction endodeoxyribonuclease RuvC [Candidatus Cerribacteria bacterium 'Amazon FNV 2010 28 9']|uniref:Crossover junction endodeoxyribonuclease RuvC n=1 Tax=Candidatus Cerribacteria bacterium 'Amazon FNV 2010 28 9' TaxID=2081795 RepID=A0A317JQ54_9BACT|nr:MAG: crossover junction endodeoxyribonuclease RuvC [Candidatus Cerribacteria bacterium 'Amazon FNV 2010 28 9']